MSKTTPNQTSRRHNRLAAAGLAVAGLLAIASAPSSKHDASPKASSVAVETPVSTPKPSKLPRFVLPGIDTMSTRPVSVGEANAEMSEINTAKSAAKIVAKADQLSEVIVTKNGSNNQTNNRLDERPIANTIFSDNVYDQIMVKTGDNEVTFVEIVRKYANPAEAAEIVGSSTAAPRPVSGGAAPEKGDINQVTVAKYGFNPASGTMDTADQKGTSYTYNQIMPGEWNIIAYDPTQGPVVYTNNPGLLGGKFSKDTIHTTALANASVGGTTVEALALDVIDGAGQAVDMYNGWAN